MPMFLLAIGVAYLASILRKARAGLQNNNAGVGTVKANPEKLMPEWEEIAAVASAVQNMWLTATALGAAGMAASLRSAGPSPLRSLFSFISRAKGGSV